MSGTRNTGNPRRGKIALFITLGALAISFIASGFLFKDGVLGGQSLPGNPPVGSTGVFTPSHPTVALAVRHFFGIRPEAVQPLAYAHKPHIEKAQMECLDCHVGVATGPRATIPGAAWCMTCHADVAKDKPAVQQIAAYFNKGEDIPWQRVYGWNDEAHVRFNHAPHIAANVSCAKCHGDVGAMMDAKRVVDHSMGFCITCHKERKASIDCVTCHF